LYSGGGKFRVEKGGRFPSPMKGGKAVRPFRRWKKAMGKRARPPWEKKGRGKCSGGSPRSVEAIRKRGKKIRHVLDIFDENKKKREANYIYAGTGGEKENKKEKTFRKKVFRRKNGGRKKWASTSYATPHGGGEKIRSQKKRLPKQS